MPRKSGNQQQAAHAVPAVQVKERVAGHFGLVWVCCGVLSLCVSVCFLRLDVLGVRET